MSIKVLESRLADQIAAGEVVDRPGAVVKELIENSIDAGASQLTIFLEKGGQQLIEVQDNGRGIPSKELPLTILRHATSKISVLSDLSTISTMGFRGEALAAISAVSRFSITSCTGESSGRSLTCESSTIIDDTTKVRTRGTTIRVENLFFNTPVRKKFLNSLSWETNYCKQMVLRMVLGNPDCGFTLHIDGKKIFSFPAQEEKSRVYSLFTQGLHVPLEGDKELLYFYHKEGEATLSGYILPMKYCLPTSRSMFTFVNKRLVRDKVLQQAILSASREVLFGEEYPQLVLFLDMDPKMVDVNVHPTKSELRFRDPSPFRFVYKSILATLAQLRLPTGPPNTAATTREEQPPPGMMPPRAFSPTTATPTIGEATTMGGMQTTGSAHPSPPRVQFRNQPSSFDIDFGRQYEQKASPTPMVTSETNIPMFLGTIKNTYLVCQDEDGLLLVDQHAAHERVTYERLRRDQLEKNLHSAPLLIPIVVELNPDQLNTLEKKFSELTRMGLYLERLGSSQVRITELPSLLLDKEGTPRLALHVLIQKLADLLEEHSETELLIHTVQRVLLDVIATQSCHSSVRAGQNLSSLEANALLEQMQKTDYGAHCPHGRPTSVRLSWKEIEKLFKRIS